MYWLGRLQLSLMVLVSAMTVVVGAGDAFARPAGGISLGSRGLRALQVSPAIRTTPRQTSPLDRAIVQPAARNIMSATPRAFQRPGLIGGLAAGFMGAGILGMLFGNGFFGGVGGFASLLGLFAQIAVLGFAAWMAWSWWQRRSMATFVGLSPRQLADAYDRPRADFAAMPDDAAVAAELDRGVPELQSQDFDTFERLLGEIHIAHARGDLARLRTRVTADMLEQFMQQRAPQEAAIGHAAVDDVRKVTLLRGDVAELWREREVDFARVALRYAVDGASRIEVSEAWTFRRAPGGEWQLSAIQPA